MDAICGILGKSDIVAVRAMAAAMSHRGDARHLLGGDAFTVASSSPLDEGCPCLVDGEPRDESGRRLSTEALQQRCSKVAEPSHLSVRGGFSAAVRVGKAWWLIRDRLGVKPLYYALCEDCCVFASELKGILASGYVRKHLNLASVDRYLTLRCVPGPDSIIQGVSRVVPGHVVAYAHTLKREQHTITDAAHACFDLAIRDTSRDDAADALRDRLREAVDATRAEVLLWSAGLDCAALGALKPGCQPVFVTLKSAWQEESWRARESARLMGLSLKQVKAPGITETTFARVAYHLDEPIADAFVLPLWSVAEQAAEVAPILMSGHGADELLGGYPRYHFLQKAQGAKRLVPSGLLSSLAPMLPPNVFVRRGERYLTSLDDNIESFMSLLAVFDSSEREELYTDAMKAAIYEKGGSASILRPHFAGQDLTRNLLSLALNVVMPELLLAKCDRIAAAHGVSLELPYLDDALVDLAISLPPAVKFGVRSKPVLRQAMKGVLPGRIRLRARRDFKIPQSGPALRVIDSVAREIVTQERVVASGLFKWSYVDQVMRSAAHNVYRRRQFWALLMFFAWHREMMET